MGVLEDGGDRCWQLPYRRYEVPTLFTLPCMFVWKCKLCLVHDPGAPTKTNCRGPDQVPRKRSILFTWCGVVLGFPPVPGRGDTPPLAGNAAWLGGPLPRPSFNSLIQQGKLGSDADTRL